MVYLIKSLFSLFLFIKNKISTTFVIFDFVISWLSVEKSVIFFMGFIGEKYDESKDCNFRLTVAQKKVINILKLIWSFKVWIWIKFVQNIYKSNLQQRMD